MSDLVKRLASAIGRASEKIALAEDDANRAYWLGVRAGLEAALKEVRKTIHSEPAANVQNTPENSKKAKSALTHPARNGAISIPNRQVFIYEKRSIPTRLRMLKGKKK
ncbi:MAG TPA: hypothetical protein PLD47_13875 [Aggregatilineales bacterium]|nr:MAG: hypothetical protein HKUEN02_01140 [Anaerolineaceae bacterium]HRE48810.1 hypothetical protein [Aggregatilineales bacterium]